MIIGTSKWDLDTPALWVDLDVMEGNMRHLADYFRQAGVGWRPHTKGIKVPAVAHKLLQAGAIGVTCAKLGEAEVMAAAGIRDILVANQVVGPIKVARLVNLRRSADVIVAVDSLANVQEISSMAADAGVTVRLLIEINTGMNRAGLEPGQPVLDFARKIGHLPGIDLAGAMAWEGHAAAIPDLQEKKTAVHQAVESQVRSVELCRQAGFKMPIVSCGGSGTYPITALVPGVTEIQAGGAVLTDVAYLSWGVMTRPALFVMATVTSRPAPTRAIVDAGRKAMNSDAAMPAPVNLAGVKVTSTHAEHGLLALDSADIPLNVGDKIEFVVGYGDNTVHLHDFLYGVRKGKVEAVWPILGRGKLM